ncbi:hypothetical protein KO488_00750 [Poseidonibacter lekithochrous]|uniref:bacteriophage T4 gp5 trimerisation domain-containing protein n=1 Tax=Poseidonibacter TaxID=2321187 RepID=UPI001C09266F|nr:MULTISPECIES: phage baseplate assembly protein V [Poseidonibacter]MBU3013265.1 hypothetical protein [Poseidonibacter lekithochrous]MDO6826562.1 phage baseplate assembly protein V [Poseidonibacter sp. 1_MG-2023]
MYSGNDWGAQFFPRVNTEVIVSFINGNIDKPIIIGAVYNGNNKIPYDPVANKTQSYIKTQTTPGGGGYNELLFEDKAAAELLSLRAQKDYKLHAATRSWFLLDLFSFVSKIEINKKIAIAPRKNKYEPFYDVLQDWDTQDEALIDKHITMLCEYHLIYATSQIENDSLKERMKNYEIPCFQIFPYEILAWLKLREQHGLKNPNKFTHELMNTKIVKVFLELDTPLAEVEDLPFEKEVLSNLKAACPDMKI